MNKVAWPAHDYIFGYNKTDFAQQDGLSWAPYLAPRSLSIQLYSHSERSCAQLTGHSCRMRAENHTVCFLQRKSSMAVIAYSIFPTGPYFSQSVICICLFDGLWHHIRRIELLKCAVPTRRSSAPNNPPWIGFLVPAKDKRHHIYWAK